MSDDKYQRVWYRLSNDSWVPSDGVESHKVVPADAIVIERSDLPEIGSEVQAQAIVRSVGGYWSASIETAERNAYAALAAIGCLRASPPVDEAQVTAVRALIRDEYDRHPTDEALARRLVARGMRVEAPDA